MTSSCLKFRAAGFGLIELMIAMALGLIISAGMLVIFLAQRQVYRGSTSQALMQDADNAITAAVSPTIRGAGFYGCGGVSNGIYTGALAGLPSALAYSASAVQGFYSAMPTSITDGAANDSNAGDWSPSLDTTLLGNVEQGSDVLIVSGATAGSIPTSITQAVAAAVVAFTYTAPPASQTYQPGAQLVALSDCNKSAIFEAAGINAATTTVTLNAGPGIQFTAGSQFIPVQQTAFFVGKGYGNQSALFESIMTPTGWGTPNEIVPGITSMKVLYGITTSTGNAYVNASQIASNGGWNAVTSVRIAFLVEGNLGSAVTPAIASEGYLLFGSSVKFPSDSRMRHVFYLTANTRNNTLP